MKVVNLSRRPFINRRPVVRVAACLWVLGGLLLLVNVWLYASHFSGSEKGQGRLQSLNRQVQQEEDRISELWKELKGLNLGNRNRKARYLNSLIHTRTFPWSALFDDLEKVLPIDIYLGSVQPSLRLAKQPAASASVTPTRALTAREARARARGESTAANEVDDEELEEDQEEESFFSGDRVTLTLRGYARNDEALFEFVDRLYQSPSFLDPNLPRESKDKSGKLSFNIKVIYLTPKRNAPPPEEGDPGADLALASDGSGNSPEMVTVIEESVPVMDGQPSTLRSTGSSVGTDSRTRTSTAERGRDTRNVRRAGSQVNSGFPPEEGESEAEQARRRRNSRSGGSRSVTRAPSTVSVAPGATTSTSSIEDARARERAEKEARARERAQRRLQQQNAIPGVQRATPSPTRPGARPGTRPSTTRSGSTTPSPALPAASSSPRLQGSLFDRWIPDFLLWTPDFSEPSYAEPRNAEPSYVEALPVAQELLAMGLFSGADLLTEVLPATGSSVLGHIGSDSSRELDGSICPGPKAASVDVASTTAYGLHRPLAVQGPDRRDRLLPPLKPPVGGANVLRYRSLATGVAS